MHPLPPSSPTANTLIPHGVRDANAITDEMPPIAVRATGDAVAKLSRVKDSAGGTLRLDLRPTSTAEDVPLTVHLVTASVLVQGSRCPSFGVVAGPSSSFQHASYELQHKAHSNRYDDRHTQFDQRSFCQPSSNADSNESPDGHSKEEKPPTVHSGAGFRKCRLPQGGLQRHQLPRQRSHRRLHQVGTRRRRPTR